jgi:FdhD protein
MQTFRPRPLVSFDHGHPAESARMLPEEVAVALSYNGSTHAVMMATPADLEDFGYGFSLTEGIAAPEEIESLEIVETELGLDLQMWLRPEAHGRLARRRRTMAGPVGCGLCGIDSLEEATRKLRPVAETGLALSSAQVQSAVASLPRHQPLQDVTRAVHAAAFWSAERGLAVLREDVGRHNALDKLAGALQRENINPGLGAVIITSRVSIDMVQKTAALGVPVLVAVSAPTTAAVSLAEASGITLVALARESRFEVYSRSDRIFPEEATHVA